MLDLDVRHLDPPGIGLGVQHLLDIGVELFPLGQQLIQLVLAEHRAQRGLGQLTGGGEKILHLDNRFLRVASTRKLQHRINLHRDVVAGDHVLGRDIVDHGAQVHPDHLLHQRKSR